MWEPVPPAPRVPDPQAPSRVRGDSAGDLRATHTHTHAHTRTHARARKPAGPLGAGLPRWAAGEGTSAHRSGCRWTSGSFHRGTAAYALLSSEKAQESSWRDARGVGRLPAHLGYSCDRAVACAGRRGPEPMVRPGASRLVRRAGAPPGAALPGGPGLGHASAGSARHFGTFGRAAPLQAGARAPRRGGRHRHRGSRLLRVLRPGAPRLRGPRGGWLGAWRAAWESGGRERPQEGLHPGGRRASEATPGTGGRGTGKRGVAWTELRARAVRKSEPRRSLGTDVGPGLLDFLARAVTLGKSFATLGASP